MPNPRLRKTVAKAMVQKRGTTAIAQLRVKKRRFTNPSTIQDPHLRERFDKEKSWLANLASTDLKEMYEQSLPETIASKAAWTLSKLSEDEVVVVRKLIGAHGETSYRKMAFDRKLNKLQWTEEQCEKKVKLLVEENRVHVCEDGKCLCGYTPNSSYVARKDRVRD